MPATSPPSAHATPHQLSFADAEDLAKRKRTRHDRFLGAMEQVVALALLLTMLAPYDDPNGGRGAGATADRVGADAADVLLAAMVRVGG